MPSSFEKHECSGEQPGEQDDLGRAGEHLQRADERGYDELPATFADAGLDGEQDPREEGKRGDVVWPHERLLHEAVEGEGHAGERGGEVQLRPPAREGIRAEAAKPEVQ